MKHVIILISFLLLSSLASAQIDYFPESPNGVLVCSKGTVMNGESYSRIHTFRFDWQMNPTGPGWEKIPSNEGHMKWQTGGSYFGPEPEKYGVENIFLTKIVRNPSKSVILEAQGTFLNPEAMKEPGKISLKVEQMGYNIRMQVMNEFEKGKRSETVFDFLSSTCNGSLFSK